MQGIITLLDLFYEAFFSMKEFFSRKLLSLYLEREKQKISNIGLEIMGREKLRNLIKVEIKMNVFKPSLFEFDQRKDSPYCVP